MPLPIIDCDSPPPVCCTGLYEHAQRILGVAFDAVQACVPDNSCLDREFHGYVSHGFVVQDPVPDYVTVSMVSLGPSVGSRSPQGLLSKVPIWHARFKVVLIEANWPTVEDNGEEIWVPSPEQMSAAALHLYSHGESMFRALADMVVRRKVAECGCEFHNIDPLSPIEAGGGAAGWETYITVGVDLSGRRHGS